MRTVEPIAAMPAAVHPVAWSGPTTPPPAGSVGASSFKVPGLGTFGELLCLLVACPDLKLARLSGRNRSAPLVHRSVSSGSLVHLNFEAIDEWFWYTSTP